ncbi:MAG: cytochrome C [Desulfuromonadales bacterium]|nr:cytochrome C [Desulfuromonadales bacterium]
MANRSLPLMPIVLLALLLLAACATMQGVWRAPAQHPEELGPGRPTCTECHPARDEQLPYERFDHSTFFMDNHTVAAHQGEQVCRMCHATSFCNDCHATRVELKPSDRHKTETYRRMPHRGDYLTRHRIDGRIDPMSCFRCHGNPKTSRSCAPCHP